MGGVLARREPALVEVGTPTPASPPAQLRLVTVVQIDEQQGGRGCFARRHEQPLIGERGQPGPGGARGGRIVNIAARPALEPRLGAGMVAYTASKSAVAALTQALAQETTEEEIWINAVAPSVLDTPANRAAMPDADHRRWVAPADLAEIIVFLTSSANRVTRGAVIPVYGGS